ncbi:hypothetical protein Q8W34_17645 [Pseudoalteromonas marina]|uniref:YcaO domain-containing protein n=2 Tax=Pseudoalteromonas marina TaxID=267375 RepID=A0ABT9FI64_9GAMM|nr:hypothetical protein [Pseudoalteromonas marina]
MYIKDKAGLNDTVREVRKALKNNGADVKYNTTHQIFARSHDYKTQASLLSDLPSNITLNTHKALTEELLIDEKHNVKSNLVDILEKQNEGRVKYEYLLVRLDLLMHGTHLIQSKNKDTPTAKPTKEWLQECIGDAYKIIGGVSKTIGEEFECDGFVFKGLNNLFKGAVEASTIVNVNEDYKYNPFTYGNDSEIDGWFPNLNALSKALLLRIESTNIFNQGNITLPEHALANIRNEILEEFHNQGKQNPCLLCGELAFKPVSNINVFDFSQDTDDEGYFESKEEFKAHLNRAPITHLSNENDIETFSQTYNFCEPENEAFYKLLLTNETDCYDTQRSHIWAMEMLNKMQKTNTPIPIIEILVDNEIAGCMVFSENNVKITISHYDLFGEDGPNLAACVNHGKIKDIRKVFPDAQYFCNDDKWPFIYDQDEFNSLSSQAILNVFGEAYRNWPSNISMEQSRDKFAFELHGPELIKIHGINKVCVDDFQETFGDMTGVLLTSFYDEKNQLVAELSYCVLQQNDRADETSPCIELTLDSRLKSFCEENNIEILWSEHTIFHPYGERQYNQSIWEDGLIASNPHSYEKKSILLMAIRFPSPKRVNHTDLNNIASTFLESCITSDSGKKEQFKFRTNLNSDIQNLDYESITEGIVNGQSEQGEQSIYGIQFIGGYHMKGMAISERTMSVSNTLIGKTDIENPKNKVWFKLNEETTDKWCDALKIAKTSIEINFYFDPFEMSRYMTI